MKSSLAELTYPVTPYFLDTNVLVKAFLPSEDQHNEARYFIDEFDHQWFIPVAVIVETWGFLVGKSKNWQAGLNLLSWLITPGKNLTILPQRGEITEERKIIEELRIDCVDAVIVSLATQMFRQCALERPLLVATFDTSDFFRLIGRLDIGLSLYDLKELVIQDFDLE